MDLLRDLPSHSKDNFSRHTQGSYKAHTAKEYLRVREEGGGRERKAQVIVMETQSLVLRELERKRAAVKRRSANHSTDVGRSRKVRRTDSATDPPAGYEDS